MTNYFREEQTPEQMALQLLKGPIVAYAIDEINSVGARSKIVRLAKVKRNRLYLGGQQYLLKHYGDRGRSVVDYQPLSLKDMEDSGIEPSGMDDPVYNQVRSLGRKFLSALAQRAPNCQTEPLVESDETQSAISRAATKIVQALRKQWPIVPLQKQMVITMFIAGTPFARVNWVTDSGKYGEREEVTGEIVSDNPDGTQEVQQEVSYFANGMPEVDIFSEEEVSIPPLAKKFPEDAHFLILSEQVRQGVILRRWPEAERLLSRDSSSNSSSAITQQFNANLRGANLTNYEEVTTLYLGKNEYPLLARRMAEVKMSDGSVQKPLEYLDQTFPLGLKASIIKNTLLSVEHSSIPHSWSAGIGDFSDFVLCDALVDDFIQPQDALNTQMAIMHETMESGMPITLVNSDTIDQDALRDGRTAVANRVLPVSMEGGSLRDQTHNLPQSSPDPRIVEWTKWAVEMGKELIGILPAIYGGDVGVTQTAYEAERRLNQALMQLAICWMAIVDVWTGIYTNALRMIAFYPTTALEDYGITEEELALLRECFKTGTLRKIRVSVEEAIPATRTQLGGLVREMLQLGPQAMSILEVDSPDNAGRVRDALGLGGWNSSIASLRSWVRNRIQLLLQEVPQPGGTDPMTGQEIPAQPSMPIDPTFGDPMVIGQLGRNWLITEGEKILDQDPGSPGYQNVLLWVQGYQQLAQQMAQPPAEQ